MNKTENINFRLEPHIKAKLELLAAKQHRSVSNLLQLLVEKMIKENE